MDKPRYSWKEIARRIVVTASKYTGIIAFLPEASLL
jgi:hypothetical protein